MPIAGPLVLTSSSARAFAPLWLMSATTTAAPSWERRRAVAAPIPLAPPVTMATFSLKREGIEPPQGLGDVRRSAHGRANSIGLGWRDRENGSNPTAVMKTE